MQFEWLFFKNDIVKSEDVRTSILERKIAKETDSIKQEGLLRELDFLNSLKRKTKSVITEIASLALKGERIPLNQVIENKMPLTDHQCYVPVVDYLFEKCFDFKVDDDFNKLFFLNKFKLEFELRMSMSWGTCISL